MQDQVLTNLVQGAFTTRHPLSGRLPAEETNACRLFNGSAENRPGSTVDRYGHLLLIQGLHNLATLRLPLRKH